MEELQGSLDAYEVQLEQVRSALLADPGNSDLLQLLRDLEQVVLLTSQSLLEEKKRHLLDRLDDAQVVKEKPAEKDGRSEDVQQEDLDADLEKLVGMKCR